MLELKMNIPYKFDNTPEALEELCKLIRNFIKQIKITPEKIMNICINISGRVNPESGYSFSMFNFSERPLAEVLTEKIGFPVCIDNDTRAMTYGEYMKGNVTGEKNIIFVNISWGLGIGIIIDGKIYTGKSGFSGEFGHVNVFDNEIICHCGKKGCLETEASGSAFHRIFLERIKNGETSILSNRLKEKNKPRTNRSCMQGRSAMHRNCRRNRPKIRQTNCRTHQYLQPGNGNNRWDPFTDGRLYHPTH